MAKESEILNFGSFVVSDVKYVIQLAITTQIDELPSIPEFKGVRIAEVSFFEHTQGDSAFSTNNKVGFDVMKLYSIIGHAVADKMKEYDVYYFNLNARHSDTERQYKIKHKLAEYTVKELRNLLPIHFYAPSNKSTRRSTYILSKIKLSDKTEKTLGMIHPLKEAMRNVGLSVDHFNL